MVEEGVSRPDLDLPAQRTYPWSPPDFNLNWRSRWSMTGFRAQDPMLAGRVAGFLLQNLSHLTRPLIYTNLANSSKIKLRFEEIQRDNDHIWWDQARFKEIQANFGEISTIFGEIQQDSRRSKLISVRSQPYLVRSKLISARSWPYLVRSSKIQGDPSWFRWFLVQMEWVFADSGEVFEDSGDICRIRRLSPPTELTRASLKIETNLIDWCQQ